MTKPEQAAVKSVMSFFSAVDSGLIHNRIEAELDKHDDRVDKNRAIAVAREGKRRAAKQPKEEHETSTNRAQNVHETSTNDAPIPLTSNHKPVTIKHKTDSKTKAVATLPGFVDPEVWAKFLEHRGSKFTANAKDLTIEKLADFHAAGQDVNQILKNSIASGWKGVFAEKGTVNGHGYESARDKSRRAVAEGIFGKRGDTIEGVSTRHD